jgi:hypothetical protein
MYDWEDDRQRFCDGASRGHVDSPSEEWLAERLDQAAAHAKAGALRDAAKPLEEIRAKLVSIQEFQRWDDGILCFANLIKFIRHMSPETTVTSEYQRLLDAEPSLKWNEDMTPKQKAFWYGPSNEQVGGVIQIGASPGKSGCLVLLSGVLTLGLITLVRVSLGA